MCNNILNLAVFRVHNRAGKEDDDCSDSISIISSHSALYFTDRTKFPCWLSLSSKLSTVVRVLFMWICVSQNCYLSNLSRIRVLMYSCRQINCNVLSDRNFSTHHPAEEPGRLQLPQAFFGATLLLDQ